MTGSENAHENLVMTGSEIDSWFCNTGIQEKAHMIKGMIFDFDGTLLDSMGIWEQIDIDFLGKRGLLVPPDYLEKITPMGFLNAAKYTKARFGFPETPGEIEEEWLSMAEDAYAHAIAMKPGAKHFLEQCRTAGLRLAAATSSLERLYQPCLRHHGVENVFQEIVTTREAGEDKHSPRIYRMAADRLGLAPAECIVFEDILLGIRTAKQAGFRTAAVYDKTNAAETDALQSLADFYVESYENVKAGDFL